MPRQLVWHGAGACSGFVCDMCWLARRDVVVAGACSISLAVRRSLEIALAEFNDHGSSVTFVIDASVSFAGACPGKFIGASSLLELAPAFSLRYVFVGTS